MTKIANINLDIRKNKAIDNEPIVLRQGDSDVTIEASISNDGYPNVEIDFATFSATKPDGTIISNDPANVNGNTISYPISKHLTDSVGKIHDAYFMINNKITTSGFDISIIPSTQLDDASGNYIPGLENVNKFLKFTEADWLGRIQQMKSQIAGLSIPDEFKLLMDKALSDAKAQYQPIIDAAEENVESIAADLAAKKLDLQNNSDELNTTITAIKAQIAPVDSFLDNIQKQIIDANASFTADQQAKVAQSISDLKAQVSQSIANLKAQTDALASGSAFKSLQTQVNESAVGTNLLLGTSKALTTVTNASGWNTNLPTYQVSMKKVNSDTTYTARAWISPVSHDMNIQIVWKDESGNEHYGSGSLVSPGTSGYSTWTGTIPAGNMIDRVTIIFYSQQSTASSVSYCATKLEKGSTATDWCPNPSEILTQSDYAKIKAAIVALGGSLS